MPFEVIFYYVLQIVFKSFLCKGFLCMSMGESLVQFLTYCIIPKIFLCVLYRLAVEIVLESSVVTMLMDQDC